LGAAPKRLPRETPGSGERHPVAEMLALLHYASEEEGGKIRAGGEE
jgi:hypothetical protein